MKSISNYLSHLTISDLGVILSGAIFTATLFNVIYRICFHKPIAVATQATPVAQVAANSAPYPAPVTTDSVTTTIQSTPSNSQQENIPTPAQVQSELLTAKPTEEPAQVQTESVKEPTQAKSVLTSKVVNEVTKETPIAPPIPIAPTIPIASSISVPTEEPVNEESTQVQAKSTSNAPAEETDRYNSHIIFISYEDSESLRVEIMCKSSYGNSQSRINDPVIGINNWENTVISRAYCSGKRSFYLDGLYWRITE